MSNATLVMGSGIQGSSVREASVTPNYALRRIGALLVLVAAVILLAMATSGLLAGFGGDPASASEAQPAPVEARTHVAQPGESLWSIATTYRGDVGLDDYLHKLIELNGGTGIIAGQAVLLP